MSRRARYLPQAHPAFPPRHNGKVERSHREDQQRFHCGHCFCSLDDFGMHQAAHKSRSNSRPSRPIGWASPRNRLDSFPVQSVLVRTLADSIRMCDNTRVYPGLQGGEPLMKQLQHGIKVLFWTEVVVSAPLLILIVNKSHFSHVPDFYISNNNIFELPSLTGLSPDSLLNSGSAAELDQLPGIGEVLAHRIIETRERDGIYFFPEDIMTVNGIGEKRFANIMQYLNAPQATSTDLFQSP